MTEFDFGSFSTPDVVLWFIPGLLLASLLAVGMLGVSTRVALTAGSLPATGAIGYVLFLEPPVETEPRDTGEN